MPEYFPHDFGARNDPKLEKLFIKLSHEGCNVFWRLVEMLYEQGGYLKISDLDYYAVTLNTSTKLLKSLINDFDLFKKDKKMFWSESVLKRLEIRLKLSKKRSEAAFKSWENRDAKAMQLQSKSNAIKEKEIKENKIKENKSKDNMIESAGASPATPSKLSFADKELAFKKTLTPFVATYGKEMLKDFFDYWSEPNKSKTRMRVEGEKTWDISRRLAKWDKNQIIKNQAPGAKLNGEIKPGRGAKILSEYEKSMQYLKEKYPDEQGNN